MSHVDLSVFTAEAPYFSSTFICFGGDFDVSFRFIALVEYITPDALFSPLMLRSR